MRWIIVAAAVLWAQPALAKHHHHVRHHQYLRVAHQHVHHAHHARTRHARVRHARGRSVASGGETIDPVGAMYAAVTPRVLPERTAVYDIAAHTVHVPRGKALEAHSGLGGRQDNPRYVGVKSHGPTPPNLYRLQPRGLFHGVRALRLVPAHVEMMFGRSGILAHSYLRGRGQTAGCVAFRNYAAFLTAFLHGEVRYLLVVAGAPPSVRLARR
jgi:hypothetical protein